MILNDDSELWALLAESWTIWWTVQPRLTMLQHCRDFTQRMKDIVTPEYLAVCHHYQLTATDFCWTWACGDYSRRSDSIAFVWSKRTPLRKASCGRNGAGWRRRTLFSGSRDGLLKRAFYLLDDFKSVELNICRHFEINSNHMIWSANNSYPGVAAACRQTYSSLLESGHESVLDHRQFLFHAINGVSAILSITPHASSRRMLST